MPLVVTVSAVALLVLAVAVLIRYAGLKTWHSVVCVLAGFYLASTGFAPDIQQFVTALTNALTGAH